jgi:flagellar biosynthesis chaperone FliJ
LPLKFSAVEALCTTFEIKMGGSMAGKHVLRRLLRIRELEEDQRRLQLEALVMERDQVASTIQELSDQELAGRHSVIQHILEPDGAARAGALITMQQLRDQISLQQQRLETSEAALQSTRDSYLSSRTARLQIETLLELQLRLAQEQADRRSQQVLDQWYGQKIRNQDRDAAPSAQSGNVSIP